MKLMSKIYYTKIYYLNNICIEKCIKYLTRLIKILSSRVCVSELEIQMCDI